MKYLLWKNMWTGKLFSRCRAFSKNTLLKLSMYSWCLSIVYFQPGKTSSRCMCKNGWNMLNIGWQSLTSQYTYWYITESKMILHMKSRRCRNFLDIISMDQILSKYEKCTLLDSVCWRFEFQGLLVSDRMKNVIFPERKK